jgi:quercetin dioxygenase-like cupin family protein
MPEVKSTLKVIHDGDLASQPPVTEGQTMKYLVGCEGVPADRLRVGLATYAPGRVEQLHWHPIEALYYVVSGHAVVRNYEGVEVEAGPGTVIYAPAGIAGAHGWVVKEGLQLFVVSATVETDRKLQFKIDEKTKRSYVDLEKLTKRNATSFKSHY